MKKGGEDKIEKITSRGKVLFRKMKILLRGENVPGDMFSACRPFHHSRDIPESSKEYAAASIVNKL